MKWMVESTAKHAASVIVWDAIAALMDVCLQTKIMPALIAVPEESIMSEVITAVQLVQLRMMTI